MVTETVRRLDYAQFGEVLRYHRKDAGMSLREMARKLKLSAAFLSDCERGKRRLNEKHLELYVETLSNVKR